MKPKMKYSTTKISPAKISSSAGKALVKSPKLRKSQEKAEDVCQTYFMQLRSGLLIEKKACYSRKGATGRFSPRTEQSAVLTTYNDQSISFVFEDGSYEIYVEELRKNQEKDQVLFRYYDPGYPSSQTDDSVDGQKLMVNLCPTKCKDFSLHANNKEYSVELQKCANPLPDQAFFLLHEEPSKCVSFECKNDPGVFIGVKDNHLALIKVEDETEGSSRENIIFKLS